jgi:hypothetical protein
LKALAYGGPPSRENAETPGLLPTNIITSASAKRCTPASQPPWRAAAVCCEGWSMVLGVKYQCDPMPLIQAMISGLAALKRPCVPE